MKNIFSEFSNSVKESINTVKRITNNNKPLYMLSHSDNEGFSFDIGNILILRPGKKLKESLKTVYILVDEGHRGIIFEMKGSEQLNVFEVKEKSWDSFKKSSAKELAKVQEKGKLRGYNVYYVKTNNKLEFRFTLREKID